MLHPCGSPYRVCNTTSDSATEPCTTPTDKTRTGAALVLHAGGTTGRDTDGLDDDDGYDPTGSSDERDRLDVQHAAAFDVMCNTAAALEQAITAREAAEAGSPAAAAVAAAFEAALAAVITAVRDVERLGVALVEAAGPPCVPPGALPEQHYRPTVVLDGTKGLQTTCPNSAACTGLQNDVCPNCTGTTPADLAAAAAAVNEYTQRLQGVGESAWTAA